MTTFNLEDLERRLRLVATNYKRKTVARETAEEAADLCAAPRKPEPKAYLFEDADGNGIIRRPKDIGISMRKFVAVGITKLYSLEGIKK